MRRKSSHGKDPHSKPRPWGGSEQDMLSDREKAGKTGAV